MTVYKSGTTAFTTSTAGVTAGSTNPAPASVGGSSYWYSGAAAGTADYQRWDLAGDGAWSFRRLVYVDTASATDLDLVVFRSGADAAAQLTIRIQGTDKLRIVPTGGSTTFWTSTTSFPHDGWYRLEGYGNGVSNTARVALFPVGSTTAVIDTGDGTSGNVGGPLIATTVPQGSLAPTGVRLGKASNGTGYTGKVAWDEDEVHTGATDAPQSFIGPYATSGLSCTTAVTVVSGLQVSATVTPVNYTTATKVYDFAWGDGTTTAAQANATMTHTYTAAGTYTVTGGVDYA